ncbi:MAG: (d)CMP kinase [Syntrophomonadaceae bacterium]|nr:(d)CMP kinase [Syntrophomonadaceae bacterium]
MARAIADRLGILYIDTGAMYRALTWKALSDKVDLKDGERLRQLAQATEIRLENIDGRLAVFCDGQDVTDAIRSPEVSRWVAVVAADPGVRQVMVGKQQAIARERDVVMDGRDIGLVVLPEAEFKFYLTAGLEERARRRALDMVRDGYRVDYQQLKEEIRDRDRADSERAVGALTVVPGAIVIDTSDLTAEQVVERVLAHVQNPAGHAHDVPVS